MGSPPRWAATYMRLQNLGRYLSAEIPELGGTFAGIHTPPKRKGAAAATPEAPAEPAAPVVSEAPPVSEVLETEQPTS